MLNTLRIAVTTFCGLACLLLIALWMRSYSLTDAAVFYRGGNWYGIRSEPGHLRLTFMAKAGVSDGWFFRSGMLVDDQFPLLIVGWVGNFRNNLTAYCAHWLAAIPFAVLAAAPWIKLRFSLRILLIAVTLLNLGLGTVVYLLG